MTQNLVDRILAQGNDPVLKRKLVEVLDQHDRDKAKAAENAAFAERIANPEAKGYDAAYATQLVKLVKAGTLRYGSRQWVPDEYENLERHGLVHCSYSDGEVAGLAARTLEATGAGKRLACRIDSSLAEKFSFSSGGVNGLPGQALEANEACATTEASVQTDRCIDDSQAEQISENIGACKLPDKEEGKITLNNDVEAKVTLDELTAALQKFMELAKGGSNMGGSTVRFALFKEACTSGQEALKKVGIHVDVLS